MTTAQANFVQRVALALHGLDFVSCGPAPECAECGLADIDTMDCPEYEAAGEASFSWSECDACGSTLGGDRHYAHGIANDTRQVIHLDVCVDCIFYLSYGELPQ